MRLGATMDCHGELKKYFICGEAQSHDQMNMTKIWLEYDRNIRQRQTLPIEHNQNDEYY